ncbi:hypothetical protein HY256_02540, partial [Candidatus Sumerlaeota bacterium]|nr:hypothetical protein [Candidatus Sumerlaeota bacterium]
MKRFAAQLLFFAGFAVFFAAAVSLQHVQLDRLRNQREQFRDWLYLPSSNYVKLTTAGYDQFAADFLWLRAIQTFGAAFTHGQNFAKLYDYFTVISDLDPQFMAVYSFGNLVLGEEGKDYAKGLDILDKGILNNPRRYRMPYEAAFFSYWTMDDPNRGKYYVALALKCPDCPPYVRGWYAYFDSKMGRYMAAYQNYFQDYAHFFNKGDATLVEIRYYTLRRAINDWMVTEIRTKALEYHADHGHYPTIQELESSGAFLNSEFPDWQAMNAFIESARQNQMKLPESHEETEAICKRFIRKGWAKLPPCPNSDNPYFPNFMIWQGQEPFVPAKGNQPQQENKYFCLSELDLAKNIADLIIVIEAGARRYQQEHNGAAPQTIDSFVPPNLLTMFSEPWG